MNVVQDQKDNIMRGLKLFVVAFSWYFLIGGEQFSVNGSGTIYTLVGPFANEVQCESHRKSIKLYNYISPRCWSNTK